MKYRKHNDFTLSEVGVGCYALTGVYGTKDVEEFKQMLNRAYELGINFFDTASAYGDAERVLGEVVKPYRDSIYIATKVGVIGGIKPNLSGKYIKIACAQSLERLQTSYIDLYQVHFDDPDIPVEETVGALEELVSEGKIRHYGVCHLPLERVETYCKVGNVFSVLMELSAVARSSREKLLPLCRKYGVAAIAFSVTGRGLLTGRFQKRKVFEPGDIRDIDPLFQRERFQSGLRVAEKVAEVGRQYGKTPTQVAIAWVLFQPGIICALTGSSTIAHLEENVGGSGWLLSSEDLKDLELFFKQEDAWLEQEQSSSIRQVLSKPLPKESSKAFVNLVYVIETAILLGLTSEKEGLPIFQELYGLRKALDEDAGPKLESIQTQLRGIIHTENVELL
ncbi:MAG: General stress protein 69 [Dehalococcoidia bacterium]|nr:General stress protein 69 [Chloroflexota bacterium]